MKKGIIFGIIGLIVLVAGVAVGLILISQNQDFRERASPATNIYISPVSQSKNSGDNFSLAVLLDTSTNLVTGIDIRLSFDVDNIEITSLEKGSSLGNFSNIITNDFNNSSGTISYAIFTIDKTKAITGTGLEALVINGRIKDTATAGVTKFNFGSTTSASGVDEGQNILIGQTSGTIIVTSEVTATATATATSNATATSTATATATATSNATATATSVATRTATATATSTAKTTATATSAATRTATATATSAPLAGTNTLTPTPMPLPVTGNELPTVIGISIGAIFLIYSLLIIF